MTFQPDARRLCLDNATGPTLTTMKATLRFHLASLALGLAGCCDSLLPPQQAEIRFSDRTTAPRFARVYAVGTDSTQSRAELRGNSRVILPLNLSADSTAYVFRRTTGQLDTLLIRYRRELALDHGCNPTYYQRVIPGDVPRERQVETTLGRVMTVAFDSPQAFSEVLIEIQL